MKLRKIFEEIYVATPEEAKGIIKNNPVIQSLWQGKYTIFESADGTNDYSILNAVPAKPKKKRNAMAYPVQWDVKFFDSLGSFKKRKEYADQNLEKIAAGSARIVYKIDDEKVLKLAKNKKGLAQNEVESDWGFQHYRTAEVFNVDDQFRWLEMELVKRVSPKTFEKKTGVSIDELGSFLKYHESRRQPSSYIRIPKPENDEELWENEFALDIITLMGDYDLPAGDLSRISSYGETADGDIVLVDFGLDKSVGKEHYNHNYKKNAMIATYGEHVPDQNMGNDEHIGDYWNREPVNTYVAGPVH